MGDVIIKELVTLANQLDSKGLRKEADYLDKIIKEATFCTSLALLGSLVVGCTNAFEGVQHLCWWIDGNGYLGSGSEYKATATCTRSWDKAFLKYEFDISNLTPGISRIMKATTTWGSKEECEKYINQLIDEESKGSESSVAHYFETYNEDIHENPYVVYFEISRDSENSDWEHIHSATTTEPLCQEWLTEDELGDTGDAGDPEDTGDFEDTGYDDDDYGDDE